jgi:hypothetical protein
MEDEPVNAGLFPHPSQLVAESGVRHDVDGFAAADAIRPTGLQGCHIATYRNDPGMHRSWRELAPEGATHAKAPNTVQVYTRDWPHFIGWCSDHGQDAFRRVIVRDVLSYE